MVGGALACRERGAIFCGLANSYGLTSEYSAVLLPQVERAVKTFAPKVEQTMPSAAETKLAKLRCDYEAAKAQIQALGYVIPGTLQKREYRCGKPNCR
ncbi:MAG: hypothetical protein NT154_25765 [Verrucomicrobia bacterium]|nr:hypothetical protein [Verrucomicrobiota bacterium]